MAKTQRGAPGVGHMVVRIRPAVIRLHTLAGYEKGRAFFTREGDRIYGRGMRYESASYGNPRLRSAVLILKDLGLLQPDSPSSSLLRLSKDGIKWLQDDLQRKAVE